MTFADRVTIFERAEQETFFGGDDILGVAFVPLRDYARAALRTPLELSTWLSLRSPKEGEKGADEGGRRADERVVGELFVELHITPKPHAHTARLDWMRSRRQLRGMVSGGRERGHSTGSVGGGGGSGRMGRERGYSEAAVPRVSRGSGDVLGGGRSGRERSVTSAAPPMPVGRERSVTGAVGASSMARHKNNPVQDALGEGGLAFRRMIRDFGISDGHGRSAAEESGYGLQEDSIREEDEGDDEGERMRRGRRPSLMGTLLGRTEDEQLQLKIRLRLVNARLALYTGPPHQLPLGMLWVTDWDTSLTLLGTSSFSSPNYILTSTIGGAEILGRATRLRRQPIDSSRSAEDLDTWAMMQDDEDDVALPAGSLDPLGPMSRGGDRSGGYAGERSRHMSAGSNDGAADGVETLPFVLPDLNAHLQPLIELELRWFPRTTKPGTERTQDSYGGIGELLESEFTAKLALAPLEVRYHQRWVSRVIGFFLDPWEAWEIIDSASLAEVMSQQMDSRVEVSFASVDLLLMNHMLGPSTPLLRVQLAKSSVHVEHIVNARISAAASLALHASSYNARNAHFEPMLEPAQLYLTILRKTAAALKDTRALQGDYLSIQLRSSPISLNVTHAFVEQLLQSLNSEHRDASPDRPRRPSTATSKKHAPADDRVEGGSGDFIESPYWIQNATGCPLRYMLVAHMGARGHAESTPATQHGSSPLTAPPERSLHRVGVSEATAIKIGSDEQQRMQEMLHRSSLRLLVQVDGEMLEVDGVVFDTVGTRVYTTRALGSNISAGGSSPTQTRARGPAPPPRSAAAGVLEPMRKVICEVRARDDGTNVVVVRSPLRVRNSTDGAIEVRLHGGSDGPSRRSRKMSGDEVFGHSSNTALVPLAYVVRASDEWAVPLNMYQNAQGGVSMRPLGSDDDATHGWSRVLSLAELADGSFCQCKPMGVPVHVANTEGERVQPSFFCNVEAEPDGSWDDTAAQASPVDVPLDRELFVSGRPVSIALHVPFIIHNTLAVDAQFMIRTKGADVRRGGAFASERLARGERHNLYCLDPSRPAVLSFEVDGFNPSTAVTLKPFVRRGRRDARGLQRTLQKLQSFATLVPEISQLSRSQEKVKMTDRARRPLNVHLDMWEGVGGSFNVVAFTSYWLVNKSSLPLSFRRMVPTAAGVVGGKLRPEKAVNDAGGLDDVPENYNDTIALLESGGMGGGMSSKMQPPPGRAREPFEYDPLEVTSGPQMISFTRPNWEWPFNNASVKVAGDTRWSPPFQLDQPNTLSLDSRTGPGSYELGVECRFAPAPFHRTRLVFVCNRIVLVNQLEHELVYMQVGTDPTRDQIAGQRVGAGASCVFHWPSRKHKRELLLRVMQTNDGSIWTSPFAIEGDTSGDHFVVKVRWPASGITQHLNVALHRVAPVVFVVFTPGRKESAPVMLRNALREEVRVHQKGCRYPDSLRPGRVLPYVWDLPDERRLVLVLMFGSSEANSKSIIRKEVHIDGRAQHIELKLPAGSHAGSVVPGATLPGTILAARVVHITVEPVDCQRCMIAFSEASSRHSQLLASLPASLSHAVSSVAKTAGNVAHAARTKRASISRGTPLVEVSSPSSRSPSTCHNGLDAAPALPTARDSSAISPAHSNAADKRPANGFSTPPRPSTEVVPTSAPTKLQQLPGSPASARASELTTSLAGGRRRTTLSSCDSPVGATGGLLRRASLRRAAIPMVREHTGDSVDGAASSGGVATDAARNERRRARHSTQVFSASQSGRQGELHLLQTVMRRGSTAAEAETGSGAATGEDLWMEDDDFVTRRQLHLSIECEALNISLVDGSPKELLYVTLGGLSLSASEGPNDEEREKGLSAAGAMGRAAAGAIPKRWEQRVRLQLRTIQVDNQLYNTAYPVTLASSVVADGDEDDEEADTCALRVALVRDISFSSRRFAYVRTAHVQLRPLAIALDEESARAFASFFDVLPEVSARERTRAQTDSAQAPSTLFEFSMLVPSPDDGESMSAVWSRMFIESLEVSPIGLRATVRRAPSGTQGQSLNPFSAMANMLTTALISVDDAPIRLKPLRRVTFFASPAGLAERVTKHYKAELWRVVLMVALSLDCIGKPYESVTDLAGGLYALLVKPSLALVRRPARFPRVLLFGFVEFFTAIVHVVFNIASKVLMAWANGIAILALDEAFAQRRIQRIEHRPATNALLGLWQGFMCLGNALWAAAHGFATLPSSGFTRAGWRGALAGALRALMGLLVKPVVGSLDLASKLCEGIKNTVTVLEQAQRQRPPRIFHADRVLRTYSLAEAHAQAMLSECRAPTLDPMLLGAPAPNEYYLDHFRISWVTRDKRAGPPRLLLVTTARVVLGDAERLRPLWEVPLERIARVEQRSGHVLLWTWEKVGVGTLTKAFNVVVERAIHCSDAAVLEAMFSRLWAVASQLDRDVGAGPRGSHQQPESPPQQAARGRLLV